MEHRTLGHSSLSVPALGLGCMSMSGTYGKGDDAQSIEVVHRALDLGVNLLDSSDMYGFGHNEELLGVAEAVHVRRVEEVHAHVQRVLNDPDRLCVVALAVRSRHGHAAQAERRHRERAVTERAVFHGPPLRYLARFYYF